MYDTMKKANLDMANKHLQKERSVGKMMAVITLVYYITYLPVFILYKVRFLLLNTLYMVININLVCCQFFQIYLAKINSTYFINQFDPHSSSTKPTAAIFCYLINWSNVVIDPLIYMVCNEKYRNAIKKLLKPIIVCEALAEYFEVKPKDYPTRTTYTVRSQKDVG